MEFSTIFSWAFAYDFLKGPMVWVSFIVFIFGTLFQIFKISSLMSKPERIRLSAGPGKFISSPPSPENKKSWYLRFKLSIAGVNPFMTSVTTVFHVLLLVLPIFVLGHNILLNNAFGISMVSLPENISHRLTLVVILCALIFLYRRIGLYRVRLITTFEDYLFLILAAVPFISGFLAYEQFFSNYKLVIGLHIFSGELMLMAVPFTKFIHMIFMLIVRFKIDGEHSLGNGGRAW
jgi:nitrate reductase gamma subunit